MSAAEGRKRRWPRLAAAVLALFFGGLAGRNCAHYAGPAVVDAAGIHSSRGGAGSPPVLILHGNPGSHADFARVKERLEPKHLVLAVDRPGHGLSSRAPIGLSLPEQAREVHDAAVAQGLERPIVVGFSYGGPVALAYAEEFPKDVRAIALVASLGDPSAPHITNPVQKLVALPVIGPFIAWTLGPLAAQGEIEKGLAGAFAPDPLDPAALASGQALWSSPWALRASACDWPALDASFAGVAARYGEIKVPVEIVAAGGDTLVPAAHGEYLRDHLPAARLTVVARRNHMLPYTAPEEIAAAVERAAAR